MSDTTTPATNTQANPMPADWFDPNLYGLGANSATSMNQTGIADSKSFGDWVSAIASGLGTVFGGPLGMLNLGVAMSQSTPQKPSTMGTISALAKALGLSKGATEGGPGALSGGMLEVNPANAAGLGAGALSGTMGSGLGGINGALGDITGNAGGNSMSGGVGDIGAQGDKTAEARGMAKGGPTLGALERAMPPRKRGAK